MAPRLAAPVLTVDAHKMRQIDTRNVENLHSIWTVFNRCAEAMEEGRRLENLSWRIWNRETFCCDHKNHDASDLDPSHLHPRQQPSSRDLPQLSSSVESAASSDDMESRMARSRQNNSPPMSIKRLSSSRSSLSGLASSARERHISSFALERMVLSIKERKNPKEALPAHVVDAIPAGPASAPAAVATGNQLPAQPADSCTPAPPNTASSSHRQDDGRSSLSSDSTAPLSTISSRGSRRMDSDTSADSMLVSSRTGVQSQDVTRTVPGVGGSKAMVPIPGKACAKESGKGMFMLGGSKSSGEDESSLDTRMSTSRIAPQKSSLTSQLKKMANSQPKKTTSFRDVVETRAIADEGVFESSDEEDEDDDAIEEDDGDSDAIEEDEDEGDWEDSASESGGEDEKPPVFPRIDSRANLTSRRSLLTSMMHETDRATAMEDMAMKLHASKSQPHLQHHSGSKAPPASLSKNPYVTVQRDAEPAQRTAPKPIVMSPTQSSAALALSPKTTRRNMLAAELTESLRTHLLHERAMKNQTLAASKRGIIRRHTAQGDLSQLKEYPRPGIESEFRVLGKEDEEEDEVWQQGVFGHGALGEYHERGW